MSTLASLVACTPHFSLDASDSILKQCGICELFATIQNVIDFAFKLAIPLGVGAIVVGGLFILTAADSEPRLKKGKEIITSAVIGIALTLGSWIILNSFLSLIITKGSDVTKFAEGWKDLSRVCNK